ncbi:Hypothetical protein Achr_d420 (plasmid) [Azotobacter chroococcum NCIMB 8003]|uniref:Uncharacterized protein n=2 Tax=Azotobacter chroococcum TaxID=353 RepID=A0A0C4WX96_9GAMM|nr:Hypothetical protein Achr_d420 [Azotobacter chroococcum NCIMB 8003]
MTLQSWQVAACWYCDKQPPLTEKQTMKTLNEKAMRVLEGSIPELASGAVRQAYIRALASGSTVVEVIDGQLVESRPDGSHKVLKTLPPAIPVKPGSKRRMRT